MRTIAFLLALSLVSACDVESQAEVLIDLRTDLIAGSEFDLIRVRLREGHSVEGVVGAATRDAESPAVLSQDFNEGSRAAEFAGVPFGPYTVRVELLRNASVIASRTLVVDVSSTRAIMVIITRSCSGVECPGPSDPTGNTSCLGGRCVEQTCLTGNEPGCGPIVCASPGDCPAGAECATPTCVQGSCFYQRDDAACGTSELCHPESGCIPTEPCMPSAELCNGEDEDCDGTVDEDFGLEDNPVNCGSCGTICEGGPDTSAGCVDGECVIDCDSGFGDCDGDAQNGCEQDLGQASDCGACGAECAGETPLCSRNGESFECVSGCPPETSTLCGTSCVAIASDPRHCGGCDSPCENEHGASSCLSAVCEVTRCDTGYLDCDGSGATGCETAACGSCESTCSAPGIESYSCHLGMCSIGRCEPSLGNCDNDFSNGCETSVNTDVLHCGRCGVACGQENATASCDAGICSIVSCDPGYMDCNADTSDGCEANFGTDENNCGGCGVACSRGETCMGGRCECFGMTGTVGGGAACAAGLICGNLERTCCVEGCPCSLFPGGRPCPPPSS